MELSAVETAIPNRISLGDARFPDEPPGPGASSGSTLPDL